MADQIREIAEKIVKLGLSDAVTLAPFIHAHRTKQLSGSTLGDADDEAAEFLGSLEQAKLLTRAQTEKLLGLLDTADSTGETPPLDTTPPPDPFVGRKFEGFTLLQKIGEGGMGSVYRAQSATGDKDFVVKILAPLAADPASYMRFKREGEVMAALSHPNLVRVFATGEEAGVCYIVMEYVDGPSLQAIYERKGRFTWQEATKAIRQIAMALQAAHAKLVIHRDVKPQNVLFDRKQSLLKVADFGLAKASTKEDGSVSRAGDILGSPAYIAPEQWGDHDVDARADLFALGVVFYQLLTGLLPFRGKSPADYAKLILAGQYDPIATYAPDVPETTTHVVAHLLETRREERYPSSTALVNDLERLLRGEAPDLPRLVRQADPPQRWVLVGRETFDIGSAPAAHARIDGPGIAPLHARIERTPTGPVLRDLETPGGTRVNGMRVREIALKDSDSIELGQAAPLRYRAGTGGERDPATVRLGAPLSAPASEEAAARPGPPIAVHGLVYDALLRGRHVRTVLSMIELLDEVTRTRRVERARARLVAAGVSPEEADRAKLRGAAALKRQASMLSDSLFQATKENLGAAPLAWVEWWLNVGMARLPAQVRPPGPKARGAVAVQVPGEPKANLYNLRGAESWTMGRGDEADVRCIDRSVSRKHATIYRLLTRYAVKDEGSRFGLIVAGARQTVALLKDEDVFELGRARIMFRQPGESTENRSGSSAELPAVEVNVFEGLSDLRSVHAIQALIAFLEPGQFSQVIDRAGTELGNLGELAPLVKDVLEQRRRLALEALPAITQKQFGEDVGQWQAWWKDQARAFPAQIAPEGYGL